MAYPVILDNTLEEVRVLLEQGEMERAVSRLAELHPADAAAVLVRLDPDQQRLLIEGLDLDLRADIFEQMDPEHMAQIARGMKKEDLSDLLSQMQPDMAADLLGALEEEQAADLLGEMEDATQVAPLLAYAEDTAGGIMNPVRRTLRRHMTVQEAMDFLRRYYREEHGIYYLYVLDRYRRLVGVVGLRALILAEPEQKLEELMDPNVIAVHAETDQEEVARLLAHYDLLALPVVDDQNRLLGIVTVDDLMDVLQEEATEDIQRLGGSEPLAQPYFAVPITTVARKRIGWLLLLFVGGTLTSRVMMMFESELQQILALAVFIPLLIGTGGNAGSQSVSTIIRALAIGEVRFDDAGRVLARELSTGLLVGLLLGMVGFGLALFWGVGPTVAFVVGLSLPVVCTWANIVGGLVPLLAERVGIDATVVSAPLITTIVDATGLTLYFLVAKSILGL